MKIPGVRKRLPVKVVNRQVLKGTIDGHDALVVTFRIKGPKGWFRLTVVTVNWGRGYSIEQFHNNVLRVLNHVGEREYVVILMQEIDEADAAPEHPYIKAQLEEGTTLVEWGTREPIAVSPGVMVVRQRKVMTMDQGTAIGAPAGTGPRRFFTSCIALIEGVRIGFGDQHPHRNIPLAAVKAARQRGESVTEREVGLLVEMCALVVYGGDMNDTHYPKAHKREKTAFSRGLDTIRYVVS